MLGMLRSNYLKSSGWLESADQKLALRQGQPVPWFTYSAISFLEKNLPSHLSMFEYGGGQSTVYWANRIKQVQSVDHDISFGEFIRPKLPVNAQMSIITENQSVSGIDQSLLHDLPQLSDPVRDIRTFRSGQLNTLFQAYALEILKYPKNSFDVVIVDGMARILSTWAAIKSFQNNGFIVFDNSDRDFYQPAFDMLEYHGYRRIDFWGMGPINPYEWCTSVFYQAAEFRQTRWFESPAKIDTSATKKTGILVLGYNRGLHLQSVLESLRLQGRIGDVHVYIDGTHGRAENEHINTQSIEIARSYKVREVKVQKGHIGIEKMMLDALEVLSKQYEQLIILEDDCFPIEDAIDVFENSLEAIKHRTDIYSVYGHHFGTEPENTLEFSRFQGWGWAARSDRIQALLPKLRRLFLMDEDSYQEQVTAYLTPEIISKLDVTTNRKVVNTLKTCFSWDSATAMMTAVLGQSHLRTPKPVIKNTGISKGVGHFQADSDFLRSVPFNMITLPEAWDYFDQSSQPCLMDKPSYGLDELDLKILTELDFPKSGFFVEIGGYDGVTQNNSVLLEKHGWSGMLIEAVPGNYAKCKKNRPNVIVEFAACVPFEFEGHNITVTDAGLMSTTSETMFDEELRSEWTERGSGFAGRPAQDIIVPAVPITQLFEKHGVQKIDLLILDVEGAEISVLKGLDFDHFAPQIIVAEDAYDEHVFAFLETKGYCRHKILLERKFTRDCMYTKI